jgi:predicted nucleic acid-binding protein
MSLVLDASVALKWFLAEDNREEARGLLAGQEPLVAPDLIVPEVLNGAWKAVRRNLIPAAQVETIPRVLPGCFFRLVPSSELAERALIIATALNHPVYDCFYLAAAESEGVILVTADTRLLKVVSKTVFAGFVRSLAGA